jgi:hypothetical protein
MAGCFNIRVQPTTITRPAGNRDVSLSTQGSPQVCRPLASAQPTLDQDPVSRSTLDARGRGCTGLANTKLHLQLQGDAILPILGMMDREYYRHRRPAFPIPVPSAGKKLTISLSSALEACGSFGPQGV